MTDGRRFAHGQVRSLLLELIGQQPRYGYQLLAALTERFSGDYRPSPGTVYPRLRRLEAEGLIRHEVLRGRKVYHLTSTGRAELANLPGTTGTGTRTPAGTPADTQDGPLAPTAPVGQLSDAIRGEVEEIVRDFQAQFTYTVDRPAQTSEDRDWLSWAAWATPAPAAPQPSARDRFQQQLDKLAETAQQLLAADGVSDEALQQGAQLLAETTATLRARLPRH